MKCKINEVMRIKSFQTKLSIIISLIVILTVSILGIILLKISSNALSNSIMEGFVSSSKGIVKTINFMTLYEQNKIEKFKNNYIIENFLKSGVDRENANDLIINDNENNSSSFETYVINKDGIIVLSNLPSSIGEDASHREYFGVVKKSLESYTSNVLISITTGKTMATIAQPIIGKDGEFLGMVGRDINTTYYAEVLKDFISDVSNIFILDNNSNVVYHDNVDMIGKPINIEAIDSIVFDKSKKNGFIEYKIDKEKIARYSTIDDIGWKVFVAGEVDNLLKSVSKMRIIIVQLLIIIILVSLFIINQCSKYIVKPINLLSQKAYLVAQGDFTVRLNEVNAECEVGLLVKSFNSMMDDLEFIISTVEVAFDNVEEECNKLINVTEKIKDYNNEKLNLISKICNKNISVINDLEELKDNIKNLDIINMKLLKGRLLLESYFNQTEDLLEEFNNNIVKIYDDNNIIIEKLDNLKIDLEKDIYLDEISLKRYNAKINDITSLQKKNFESINRTYAKVNKLSSNMSMRNLSEIKEVGMINKEVVNGVAKVIEEIEYIKAKSKNLYYVTSKKASFIEDGIKSIKSLSNFTMTSKSLIKIFKVSKEEQN